MIILIWINKIQSFGIHFDKINQNYLFTMQINCIGAPQICNVNHRYEL